MTHRQLFARLLLVVYLTMLTVVSLHSHQGATSQVFCADCAHHVIHGGHLANGSAHMNDCVLCQWSSLPVLLPVLTLFGCFIVFRKINLNVGVGPLTASPAFAHTLRGPPALLVR